MAMTVLSTGCLTEGNFNQKLSKDVCQKFKECQRSDFDSEYSSVGDCVDSSDGDPATECLEAAGCEFRKDEARDCRQAVSGSSCEEFSELEWVDNCVDIYECNSEQQAEFVECISEVE